MPSEHGRTSMACRSGATGHVPQDAQKVRPARPQPMKAPEA